MRKRNKCVQALEQPASADFHTLLEMQKKNKTSEKTSSGNGVANHQACFSYRLPGTASAVAEVEKVYDGQSLMVLGGSACFALATFTF